MTRIGLLAGIRLPKSPNDERYIRQMEFRWMFVQMLDNDSDVLDGWCRWRDAHGEVGMLSTCSEAVKRPADTLHETEAIPPICPIRKFSLAPQKLLASV